MKRVRRWAPLIVSRDHESIWSAKNACRRSRRMGIEFAELSTAYGF